MTCGARLTVLSVASGRTRAPSETSVPHGCLGSGQRRVQASVAADTGSPLRAAHIGRARRAPLCRKGQQASGRCAPGTVAGPSGRGAAPSATACSFGSHPVAVGARDELGSGSSGDRSSSAASHSGRRPMPAYVNYCRVVAPPAAPARTGAGSPLRREVRLAPPRASARPHRRYTRRLPGIADAPLSAAARKSIGGHGGSSPPPTAGPAGGRPQG